MTIDLSTTTVGAFVRRRADHELGRIVAIEDGEISVDYGNALDAEDRDPYIGKGSAEVWSLADLNLATREELSRMARLMDRQATIDNLAILVGRESVERVETLTRQNEVQMERINALMAEVELVRKRWADDVATIGEALIEEAESRSWCSEFDDFVEEVNPKLHSEGLPRRVRDWSVDVMVEVRLPITISAVSADDAREIASNEWRDRWTEHDWSARDAVLGGVTQDSDTFSVEEI